MSIEEAKEMLKSRIGDDEAYHSIFDEILEARLDELDPDFMNSMRQLYEDSEMSRWYA